MEERVKPILTNFSKKRNTNQNVIDIQEIFKEPTKKLTKSEYLKEKSAPFNLILLLLLFAVLYFLYTMYLEQKLFHEYINYIEKNSDKNNSHEPTPF